MTDAVLRDESSTGSTETHFAGIVKIAETPSHVFVYLNSLSAHVIPRSAVSSGDLASFVDALRARVAQRAG